MAMGVKVASNRKKDAFGDSGSLRLLLTGYGLGLAVAWPILTYGVFLMATLHET